MQMAFTRIILGFTYFYEGNADSNSEVIVHNWFFFFSVDKQSTVPKASDSSDLALPSLTIECLKYI